MNDSRQKLHDDLNSKAEELDIESDSSINFLIKIEIKELETVFCNCLNVKF